MTLEILYQDEYLVAVNKPHGLLVHRSKLAKDATTFALQCLRDQLNRHVFPCHRLDRKTSGVLLFALDESTHRLASDLFHTKAVKKTYKAIVRGFTDDSGTVDYALISEKGNAQEAITHFKTVNRYEIPLTSGKHNTSRYSLVEISPETGRMHQIRKHFAHIFHPILGDRPHGCNKQNRLWKQKFNMTTMMLHAEQLAFKHPVSGDNLAILAEAQPNFIRTLDLLKTHHESQHQL